MITSLTSEEEPGCSSSPVKVIVSIASAVAGEDTQDQVETDADTEDDDEGDVLLKLISLVDDHDDQSGELDDQVKQVDQDHTLLSLSVRIFLISCFQSRISQTSCDHKCMNLSIFSQELPDMLGK